MSQKITIRFNPKTGEVTKTTEGYVGDACQKETEGLDKSLGITGSTCELRPEFFETKTEEQIEGQVGGA